MGDRVFVVDDDPLATNELATSLETEAGYEVEVFNSARRALAAAAESAPAALITALRLADSSGPGLINEMHAVDPDVACLLLTSAADADGTADAVAQVGPLHHVEKPVDTKDLLPKLASALARRQLVIEMRAMQAVLEQRDRALRASKRMVERTEAELEMTSSELEVATRRLMEAEQLAAVGRVLAGVAHELDRHLALVGYAEAIKARVADDPELAEFADIIVNAQKRLVAMVDEIRDFATGSTDALAREPADIASLVDEAVSLMRFDREVRQRTIERNYRAHPLAELNRQKFCQVILNLLSNAVLATQPGATITVELDEDRAKRQAVVTVVDRGVGMPGDVLRRLGEPFFTTRGDRGSGLGVGICKRIIEEHGGTLEFESAETVGTTARVTVPLLVTGGDA